MKRSNPENYSHALLMRAPFDSLGSSFAEGSPVGDR